MMNIIPFMMKMILVETCFMLRSQWSAAQLMRPVPLGGVSGGLHEDWTDLKRFSRNLKNLSLVDHKRRQRDNILNLAIPAGGLKKRRRGMTLSFRCSTTSIVFHVWPRDTHSRHPFFSVWRALFDPCIFWGGWLRNPAESMFHLFFTNLQAGIRRGSYKGVLPFAWNGQAAYLVRDWPLS